MQRAGSALNLNPHLHILAVDGAFSKHAAFYPVKPPTKQSVDAITHKVAQRVARYLETAGYLVRDAESGYLDLQADDDDAMATLIGASISYRLAFGPNAGRKAMTLQSIPATTTTSTTEDLISRQSGFSLHAGTACKPTERKKLERLCRYITRPAISEKRLSLASNGNVVYGQTCAQRLKRVFGIEIDRCEKCGGKVKVIACIEDPEVIDKILKHLGLDESSTTHNRSPPKATIDDALALS